MERKGLIRITTIPLSLEKLLEGQLAFMKDYFEIVAISAEPLEQLEAVGARERLKELFVDITLKTYK